MREKTEHAAHLLQSAQRVCLSEMDRTVSTRTIRLFLSSSPSFVCFASVIYLAPSHSLFYIQPSPSPSLLDSTRVRCHTHLPFVVLCYRILSLCYIIHAYMTCLLPLCFASCTGEKLAPFLKNRCLLFA